jgi:hypothetical protein
VFSEDIGTVFTVPSDGVFGFRDISQAFDVKRLPARMTGNYKKKTRLLSVSRPGAADTMVTSASIPYKDLFKRQVAFRNVNRRGLPERQLTVFGPGARGNLVAADRIDLTSEVPFTRPKRTLKTVFDPATEEGVVQRPKFLAKKGAFRGPKAPGDIRRTVKPYDLDAFGPLSGTLCAYNGQLGFDFGKAVQDVVKTVGDNWETIDKVIDTVKKFREKDDKITKEDIIKLIKQGREVERTVSNQYPPSPVLTMPTPVPTVPPTRPVMTAEPKEGLSTTTILLIAGGAVAVLGLGAIFVLGRK